MQKKISILFFKVRYPSHFSTDLKELLRNLLQVDLTKRYGNLKNGVDDIKGHRWFLSTDWLNIYYRKVEPPFVPKTKGPGRFGVFHLISIEFFIVFSSGDSSNFDEYEEETREFSYRFDCSPDVPFSISVRIATTEKFGKEFEEF